MNRIQLSTISIHNLNFNTHSSSFSRFLSYFRFSKKMNDLFVLIQSLRMFNFKYDFRSIFFFRVYFHFVQHAYLNACFVFDLHDNSINVF